MPTTLRDPQLRIFLPLLYVAWADGDLEPREMAELEGCIAAQPWLSPASRRALATWLDPKLPPSAAELAELRREMTAIAGTTAFADRATLADLGVAMARLSADDVVSEAEALRALQELEGHLGFSGSEVLDAVARARPVPGAAASTLVEAATWSTQAMQRELDGTYVQVRDGVRRYLAAPSERAAYDIARADYRQRVLGSLRSLAAVGFGERAYPAVTSDGGDLGPFMAALETLAFGDLSLWTKSGVQFGLFGGSIYFLGSEQQRQELLPSVAAGKLLGCYAMSELGHGSNVMELETTATYDPATQELVIHTPRESARKEWIGNAALHGTMATVFAQLRVGDAQHGVHAVLVPLRNQEGELEPGIRVGDCGAKMGLEGVDNGRIWFDQVRVPKSQLLGRFANIDDAGQYTSPIPGASRRFFTMLGTLVAGRASVAAAAVSSLKVGVAIAVRYGQARRQFGPQGEAELALLDYPSHQLRLLPRIAEAYALHFAVGHARTRYLSRTDHDTREVEAIAAAIKAYATRQTSEALLACRESCGAQGFLAINRLPGLICDSEVFKTFEGDNTVLLQLVAKALLTGYRKQFQESRFFAIVKGVATAAATAVVDKNPFVSRLSDPSHLRDGSYLKDLFEARERDLLRSAALRIQRRIKGGQTAHAAILAVQDHLLALANAHAEQVVYDSFSAAIASSAASLTPTLTKLRDLWALWRVSVDASWFLENGFFEARKIGAVRQLVKTLCAELRPQAVQLVDAFGIPDACLAAPIAFGDPGRDLQSPPLGS